MNQAVTQDISNSLPLGAEGIIFDLDGTLVDSAPDIANAANDMLRHLGRETVPLSRVRQWVGNGVSRLVKRALTGQKQAEPDPELFDRAFPLFMAHYSANVCADSRAYDGVMETLNQLQTAGFKLGCVTNKAGSLTLPLLAELGMDAYFGSVTAGDTTPHKKPHPEPLLHGCRELKVAPENCVLIGDSGNDIRAAHDAGMPVICVSYGYNQGVDLPSLNPAAMVDSFLELPPLLQLA